IKPAAKADLRKAYRRLASKTAEISRNSLQKAAVCGLTTPDSSAIDFFAVTAKWMPPYIAA
ncbi:MAG: hypothetical protein QF466_02870, partial [Desulfobacterales bacterium]|nr:hypothetical protein [Desulfobacterales bacterium]